MPSSSFRLLQPTKQRKRLTLALSSCRDKEKQDFAWQLCDEATLFLWGCGGGVTSGIGPGCVKTHTTAKCGKYNSQTRHRAISAQHDLAFMMGNFFETFYARGGRRSFRTAWARSGGSRMSAPTSAPGSWGNSGHQAAITERSRLYEYTRAYVAFAATILQPKRTQISKS